MLYPTLMGSINPKMVTATILLIMMAILWLRVFLRGRSGPAMARANGAESVQVSLPAADPMVRSVSIHPVSLPVVPGRHDRLAIDPFVFDRAKWYGPVEDTQPENTGISKTDAEEQKHRANLQRISERLVLEAVVKDTNGVPIKACVNGTVLFKGSTIQVKENGEIYELTVTEVRATEIKLVWQVFDLTIKMPSTEWLDSRKGGVL